MLEAGSGKREAGSWKPEAGSWKLEAGSWKPEAGSWKPEAGSWKLEAGSRKRDAGSQKPEAGSWKLEAGSRKPEAGSWKREAGSWKPEAGSWKREAEFWMAGDGGWGPKAEMNEKAVVRSYRDLDVYQLAFELAVKIHAMSITLPKYELFEVGSQIRRSAKSIPANIAEGFGRRRYKNDYVHFLTIALGSCDETQVHLDMLHTVGNLDDATHQMLSSQYTILGKQLNRFLQGIIDQHIEPYR